MSSTSSYEDSESAGDASTDDSRQKKLLNPESFTPLSPRKRARSPSESQFRARKRYHEGSYNDAYRVIYNDAVTDAATRFVVDPLFHPPAGVIGVSKWSTGEKAMFFAALDRLGRDDVPGIAKAIGTKSIFETKHFLLLVQKASLNQDVKRRNAKIAQQEIPAALEVGAECGDSLELAADALAWYQERFEARLEQERYGEYWLITPAVAEEIELSMKASERVQVAPDTENEDGMDLQPHGERMSSILQQIPEAELLDPVALLYLSKHYFMNPSPAVVYPWPHWSELTTELAAEPSIYRSAFTDLHSLVVSLTRRIMQTAIIQTTSRMRAHGWRTKRGLRLQVKRQDILTAVDILGLSRNSCERWRGVARRCGLRVKGAITRVGGRGRKRTVELPWIDVERLLLKPKKLRVGLDTNVESAGLTSGTDDEIFRANAIRSSTPKPGRQPPPTSESDADNESQAPHLQEVDSDSDEYQLQDNSDSDTSMLDGAHAEDELSQQCTDDELDVLENFDQTASRQEEEHLLNLLRRSKSADPESPTPKAETVEPEMKHTTRIYTKRSRDWHNWIRYRAPWEEFHKPVPLSSFHIGEPAKTATSQNVSGHRTGSASGSEQISGGDENYRQARSQHTDDLPIRGARAYAAMQERLSDGGGLVDDGNDSDNIPTQSIEYDNDDNMDLD